jgi:hypothetical protein
MSPGSVGLRAPQHSLSAAAGHREAEQVVNQLHARTDRQADQVHLFAEGVAGRQGLDEEQPVVGEGQAEAE